MPIPTKSAKAWAGFAMTSAASGEPAPNTVGMSIAVFSRIVFAVACRPARREVAEAVRRRLAHPVGVDTGKRCQDSGGRMRYQRGVVVRQQGAITLDEVEQVRHLLEIRWDVGIIPQEVRVVELD